MKSCYFIMIFKSSKPLVIKLNISFIFKHCKQKVVPSIKGSAVDHTTGGSPKILIWVVMKGNGNLLSSKVKTCFCSSEDIIFWRFLASFNICSWENTSSQWIITSPHILIFKANSTYCDYWYAVFVLLNNQVVYRHISVRVFFICERVCV